MARESGFCPLSPYVLPSPHKYLIDANGGELVANMNIFENFSNVLEIWIFSKRSIKP